LSSPCSSCWSRGSSGLSADNLIGLIAGIVLTIYLFVALAAPERF
jgi:tetrahydromethanopterin S-methyltransferase subunit F